MLTEYENNLNANVPLAGNVALPSFTALNAGQLHFRPSSSAKPGKVCGRNSGGDGSGKVCGRNSGGDGSQCAQRV
jgi:hypothetical protein